MKTIILAASVAAMMASTAVMARESTHESFRGARAQATRPHHVAPAPFHAVPYCSNPGDYLGCPPAPVHDNTPPPS